MLVVAASAAFRVTAGFSGSFTEAETGKSASNISNQGLIYLFIYLSLYPEEEVEKEEKGEKEEKRCHLLFFSLVNRLLFLRLRINRNTRPALKNCSFSFFVWWLGEAVEAVEILIFLTLGTHIHRTKNFSQLFIWELRHDSSMFQNRRTPSLSPAEKG